MPYPGYGMAIEAAYGVRFAEMVRQEGDEALEGAMEDARYYGMNARSIVLTGTAAAELMKYADEVHVDLVAVDAEPKGRLGALFLDSVSRGLAIGSKQSVLVTKGGPVSDGPLSAVFATDHSDYAKNALDAFIDMGANGIKKLKVICALHVTGSSTFKYADLLSVDTSIVASLQVEACRQTEEAVDKLRNAGYACSGEVIDASVNDAISQAMKTNQADLLVMGAQGHGFMHRLLIGSTALHQVLVEPYPVLLVRHQPSSRG